MTNKTDNNDSWNDVVAARAALVAGKAKSLTETFVAKNEAHQRAWLALSEGERRALLAVPNPGYKDFRCDLGMLALEWSRSGRCADALLLYDDLVRLPNLTREFYCNALWAVMNDNSALGVMPDRARAYLKECLPYAPANPAIFHNAACVLFELGDRDGVVENVKRASKHGFSLETIRDEPLLAPMKSDPRWEPLFSKIDPPQTEGLDEALLAPTAIRNLRLEKIGEVPDSLRSLQNLEVLAIEHSSITTLPLFLAELPKLRKLALEWNERLKEIPIEIFAAPSLQALTFFYCGLPRKYDARKINALLAGFHKASTPRHSRLLQAALLLKDEKRALALGDLVALVDALDASVIDVRALALKLIEKKLGKVTFAIPEGSELVVAGKLNIDRATLKERLDKRSAKLAQKVGPKTCAVVLGLQPNGKATALLHRGIPIALETHLRQVLEGADTPHLIEAAKADGSAAAALGELLMSDDQASVKLALEMMKSGGVPPGIFEELVLSMQRADTRLRGGLQKLFAQYASSELQDAYKKVLAKKSFYGSGETKVTSRIKALAKKSKGEIDPLKLATLLLRSNVGYAYLFEMGKKDDALATRALSALVKGDTLDLSGSELDELPGAIANLPALRRLLLRQNHLKTIPEIVLGLTALEELDLSENRLDALPEALEGMTALRTLAAGENFMQTFPSAVFRLSKLRSLDLSTKKWGRHRELPLREIPDGIEALAELEHFVFQAHALETLPRGMKQMTKLRTLDLSGGKLGQLPTWVGELPALRELDLTSVETTDRDGVKAVANALRARGVTVKGT